MFKKGEYEKLVERRKEVAKIIFDNAFMTGLPKLKRSDLYDIISVLLTAYGSAVDDNYYELDIKTIVFDDKCRLVELLDENFFERDKE